jgi:hypothetical protein
MTYAWLDIGRFRVFARPLHLNPAFTTHHVYFKDTLIGRCLSVPNEATCEWYLYQHRHPVDPLTVAIPVFRYRRGRPRKSAVVDADQEAIPA